MACYVSSAANLFNAVFYIVCYARFLLLSAVQVTGASCHGTADQDIQQRYQMIHKYSLNLVVGLTKGTVVPCSAALNCTN